MLGKSGAVSGGVELDRRTLMSLAATGFAAGLLPGGVARAASPKRGGHLVLALEGAATTNSLDPATYLTPWTYTVGYQWGNGLVELGEKGTLAPELAESWSSDRTAKVWVFKLRKGVQFHNGKELTSEDVLYTVNYHRLPKTASPAASLFAQVETIKATGRHEITVELKSPNADLPAIFTDYHLQIMPQDSDPKSGMGTGGYIIESFQPGTRALAKRNKNYWKENAAFADSVETVGVNDQTARISALMSGSVHFINRLDSKTVGMVKSNPRIKVINIPSSGFNTFPMDCSLEPYSNKDFRLAMKYAVNRERLVRDVLGGYGTIGNDQPISPFDPFFDSAAPAFSHDPDKSKFHLAKSGVKSGIELQVSEPIFPGAVDAAVMMQDDCKKVGIDLSVKRVSYDSYWSNVWLKAPFCVSRWEGRATADIILSQCFMSTAKWNESRWQDTNCDKLIVEARGELDVSKRREMYSQIQRTIASEAGVIIPFFVNYIFASAGNIAGLRQIPARSGDRAAEQLHFV